MSNAERNKNAMKRFMTCINTNDAALAAELIADDAEFNARVGKAALRWRRLFIGRGVDAQKFFGYSLGNGRHGGRR